jgi:CO/xanthine dehydrogenase Mo-binding subunit
LTAALYGQITLKNGRVRQSNFHDYQILRMNQVPPIDVHLIRNGESPGGIGEAGVTSVLPALRNAISRRDWCGLAAHADRLNAAGEGAA